MLNKRKKIVVTGGAGFIGSNIVALLNEKGHENIIIVDHLGDNGKWKNLVDLRFIDYYDRDAFLKALPELQDIDTIIHLGACSSTLETDENFLLYNNTIYSKKLFEFSIENNCRFIYASSAATYGNGDLGYDDQKEELIPLNCYGYSKQLFDQWVRHTEKKPIQWVGLKFFNVYGPHEEHKQVMSSMIYHGFHQAVKNKEIKLFTSEKEEFADGEQSRDFIYIKDVEKIVWFFLEHENIHGIYNIGTGKKRTFNDVARAIFHTLGKQPKIRYIPLPQILHNKYQYSTEANILSLRKAGYKESLYGLEDGIHDYITSYLIKKLPEK